MELSSSEFETLAGIVLDNSAIVLEPGKEYLVESRLAPIMRTEEIESYQDLIDQVRAPTGDRVLKLIVDAMTTNETSFYRDTHPWETLQSTILPELFEARKAIKHIRMWCGATSSGQEPYSLAMLIHEHFPEVARDWSVKISGIDLSPTMIQKSNEGRFTQLEVNRGLPAMMLMKYFDRDGKHWVVKEKVRDMVEFSEGNLVDPKMWSKVPLVDGIFIRNVLIYFDKDTRQGILDRAHGRLRSDGFLMLGSSETAVGLDTSYDRIQIGKTVIFRPGNAGLPSSTLPSVRTA